MLNKLINSIKNLFSGKTSKPHVEVSSQDLPEHLKIAMKELGVRELAGSKHNPRIIEYHKATSLKATQDEISWCSSFVNWCLLQAGKNGTDNAAARSFLQWGNPVEKAKVGDVVVFWRVKKNGWQGHVAFYIEENSTAVKVLGGNQGNEVCYQWYNKSQLLGYRRLA